MKNLLLVCAGLAAGVLSVCAAEWRPLFDGTMKGWHHWLGQPHESSEVANLARDANGKYTAPLGWDRDPLQVFTVVDLEGRKTLRFSGQVFGMLMTRESFSNFHLRLQFKWGEKRWPPRKRAVRDSGLLYFIHTEPGRSYGTWPGCLELQIQEHDCGDLYALLSEARVHVRHIGTANNLPLFEFDPAAESVLLAQEGPDGNRAIKRGDFENPSGDWNTAELVCLGSTSIHVINGHVVLRLEGAREQPQGPVLTGGPVALQTEGAEIFFRDIEVCSIDSVPTEFAER